ncbi:MAG: arginyltransferase [Gammaproteobacteria bacterium]|nr:arginyltransferase [Gammaproteobacteria bacterium]
MKPPTGTSLGFFVTPPHKCGYLPGRNAVTIFVDPRRRPNVQTYTLLSQHGFRRSGDHVYRPQCPDCAACIPVRIPVAEFEATRAQRRTLSINSDVYLVPKPPTFQREHFTLYERYINARHSGGSMENPDRDSYLEFLTSGWADSVFYEFRRGRELLAVAVVDHLLDGLSAVYTFFDPTLPRRSLGRLAILKQIELARTLQLKWLYLGYWIEECRKMTYKREYWPLEQLSGGTWTRLDRSDAMIGSALPGAR